MNGKKAKALRKEAKELMTGIASARPTEREVYKDLKKIYKGLSSKWNMPVFNN